ncbi:hypothetical protein QCA50_003957 [Cerrena zonata]|uniref:F-box domain-containing protein n=1 Tax=Cerrena zonata TaxID=2478898 RepID=A0AAW0GI14_9APHY
MPLSESIIDILPPEIMDEVIGHCVDDVHSLRSCSIVCKAWLPASRYHLFQNHAMRLTSRTSDEILESFECAAPSLTGYVRCIHATCRIFLQLSQLTVFPSLEALHLRNLEPSTYMPIMSCLISSYPHLKRLQIEGISYPHEWETMGINGHFAASSLVSSMKNLRELSFRATVPSGSIIYSIPAHFDSSLIPGPPPDTLTSLELYDSDPAYIAGWLLHHHVTSIQSLTLDLMACLEGEALSRYLESAGPTIKHLTLLDSGRTQYTSNAEQYSFIASCTALRTLRVGKFGKNRCRSEVEPILSILDILTAEQSLDTLVLGLNWEERRTLRWSTLETILARPQFANLRTLEVCINPAQNVKQAKKVLIGKGLSRYAQSIEVTHWK